MLNFQKFSTKGSVILITDPIKNQDIDLQTEIATNLNLEDYTSDTSLVTLFAFILCAILCTYFLARLLLKWKLYLFAGRHTPQSLARFKSDHLPDGKENDWLYLKLWHQWMQQTLSPDTSRDPRYRGERLNGRTDTRNQSYNIRNRSIYSKSWGIATLTPTENWRLYNIAKIAESNGSLRALGYEVTSGKKIKRIDNTMPAKSRVALMALLAVNDR